MKTSLRDLGRAALRRLWSSDGGNVAVLFALATPVIVAAAGLSAETSFDYLQKNRLQTAADAAAYAAALENRAGSSLAVMTSAATKAATDNGWPSGEGAIQVNSPPLSGTHIGATAAEVVLTRDTPRFFSAYFDRRPLVMQARAVAVYQTSANACILALNKTAAQAVQVQGSAILNLSSCDVMSNSVADDAVNVWGAADLTADCVMSAGGVTAKGGMHLTGCVSAIVQAPRARDPFAGLPEPSAGSPQTVPKNPKGPYTLYPGAYTAGMSIGGDVTLSPGVYHVSGGDFSVSPNSVVSGSGVTIFLASGSQVSMNNNSTMTLAAPTSGTYAGILFFGDRASTGGTNTFNGTASSHLTGDLYFPTQAVRYLGNYSGVNGCTHIVADTVEWTGNTTVSVDCAAAGMSPIPARQAVKLVE